MTAATMIRTFVIIVVLGVMLGLVHYFLAGMIPAILITVLDVFVIGGIVVYLLILLLRAVGVKV